LYQGLFYTGTEEECIELEKQLMYDFQDQESIYTIMSHEQAVKGQFI
jgi:hypothetical protein